MQEPVQAVKQGIKIIQTFLPIAKTSIHGFRIFCKARVFLKRHGHKYPLKAHEKKRKKFQKQLNFQVLQKKFDVLFNQQRLLLKTALILHKRYF